MCLRKCLDYFWCIKYQHVYIYMKMEKEKEKRKKEKGSSVKRVGGISAQTKRGRARPRWQNGPTRPTSGGWCGDGVMGTGPTCQRGRGKQC
jgi:hypothetical protein